MVKMGKYYLMYIVILTSIFVGFAICNFVMMPRGQKKKMILSWLRSMVIFAEKEFGSGTGEVKLTYCYKEFVQTFPKVAQFLPYETFKEWVDVALDWMKHQIDVNPMFKTYIEGLNNE